MFKAHRLLYYSTVRSRVIKQKKKAGRSVPRRSDALGMGIASECFNSNRAGRGLSEEMIHGLLALH